MVLSMTGFGQAESQAHGFRLKVELKSVNHRYLEISVRIDRNWIYLEDSIRKVLLQDRIKRGRLDVFVTISSDSTGEKRWEIDWAAVDGYVQAAKQLQAKYVLEGGLTLQDVLAQPQLIRLEERVEGREDIVASELMNCLARAAEALLEMRRKEGEHLRSDLLTRMGTLLSIHERMRELQPLAEEQMKLRMKQRIEEMLPDEGSFDPSRFAMEVALLAEKAEVTEELTRFKSHVSQLMGLLDETGSVGRRMDFLIQEMNREVNTIGSKSQALEMIQCVVDLKSELEKIREQVQNIE